MASLDKGYILIVEDSLVDYEIVTRSLKKLGVHHPVHLCEDGDRALSFLTEELAEVSEKGYPEIIFLDLNLPGTNGREVLRQLKAHDVVKKIPVVILTTSDNEDDVEVCYEAGANAYMTKPTVPERYLESLRSAKDFWLDCAILPEISVLQS